MECIDNDETASVIATLVHPKYLLILTSVDGTYIDPKDSSTLVEQVEGKDADEVIAYIDELQKHLKFLSVQSNGICSKQKKI